MRNAQPCRPSRPSRRSRRSRRAAFSAVLGLLLSAAVARAEPRDAALGANGEIFRLRTGTFGELFPGQGSPAVRANAALALDVVSPDGRTERHLVPGTDDAEVEKAPSLIYERASGTVFLVWQSYGSLIYPTVKLAGFGGDAGDAWLSQVEGTIGSPYAPKTPPQFTLTRDSYSELAEDGTQRTRQRTIMHLIWGEEDSSGAQQTLYTPVIFENGVYAGRSKIYNLNGFDTAEASATSATSAIAAPQALPAPMIRSGRDGRTVVAAFASGDSRRLISVEIDVLPKELIQLADKARAHIIDIGHRLSYPGNRQAIADQARAHIIDIGFAFHPEIVQAMAEKARADILGSGPQQPLVNVANGARAHIIDIGARLAGRGLRTLGESARTADIVQVERAAPGDAPTGDLIQFRVAASLQAPQTGPGAAKLFSSETGTNLLIAWSDGQKVFYRDRDANAGDPGSWSNTREIKLTDGLDVAKAYTILEERVNSN